MVQTRVLRLEKHKNFDKVLFRVKQGWRIHFVLAANLQQENIKLFCNHPDNVFIALEWINPNRQKSDPVGSYWEVIIKQAGIFHFYVNTTIEERLCTGSFLVDPELILPSGPLHMDSITIQTVLTKCLGSFTQWRSRLEVAHKSGYNMLHFTPVQELGESNSSYSIKNHMKVDSRYSEETCHLTDEALTTFVHDLRSDWNMLSIVDIVLNHTASNTEWITEHPECSYNLVNSPHLRPAFLVDRALWYLNKEIIDGKYLTQNVSRFISTHDLLKCFEIILRNTLRSLNLHEFYTVELKAVCSGFLEYMKSCNLPKKIDDVNINLEIIQDEKYQRHGCTINFEKALQYCVISSDNDVATIERSQVYLDILADRLHKLNKDKLHFIDKIHDTIIGNIVGHIRYHFLDDNGPKYDQVSEENPITVRYFAYPFNDSSVLEDILLMDMPEKAALVMAHNGWVMGGDALKNFAEPDCTVYLARELIAWGDSIKLNYGQSPTDCPYLWNMMKIYTEKMAKTFYGFRWDNCHSTPIHVAEYFMSCARKINPNLYVIAELFTNSEGTDNMFINRLGINSLIRENLGARSPRDLGRHVHRYGGYSVGSFFRSSVLPLVPTMAHAVFMDVTHDNPSLFEARSAFDVLPSAALVLATCSGAGSTRGYDELVPHHINVVNESRLYSSWSTLSNVGCVTLESGIILAKTSLNRLHIDLRIDGFTEVYVDQTSEEVTFVTRHSPITHESIIFVCHSAFTKPEAHQYPYHGRNLKTNDLPLLKVEGIMKEVLLEAQLLEVEKPAAFIKHEKFINGVESFKLVMQEHIPISKSLLSEMSSNGDKSEIKFRNFFPGSIIVYKVLLTEKAQLAVNVLRNVLSTMSLYEDLSCTPVMTAIPSLEDVLEKCTLADFNRILFRCRNEEEDDGVGSGVYNIPDYGDLVYAGLQGFMSVLSHVHTSNDLGHPICNNLRNGDWMLQYIVNRLKRHDGTRSLGIWFEQVFFHLSRLPRYLIPPYFDAVVTSVYERCLDKVFMKMSQFIQNGSALVQSLALGSVQMCGVTSSCSLPPISELFLSNAGNEDYFLTMAAGLPHFSTGFMRCWGRDTFISLRGLLLIPGRHETARNLILSFAGVVRHGLVPNLLATGVHARYNARDATWFWLQAIQEYTKLVKDDFLLHAPVLRMYPHDESEPQIENAMKVQLQDVVHEVFQRHFEGISFRERNAGEQLDKDMLFEGFDQIIGVDYNTGFVYGGTKHNCGTWMDKMGSSTVGKNKGHPATPRDGTAIEILGLCKSALRWLVTMYKKGVYKYNFVRAQCEEREIKWTYEEWNDKIQSSFRQHFFIGEDNHESLVHKRRIYKDTYLSSNKYTDYQLRPNFPIAMCAAPELFIREEALPALDMVEKHLLGPVGLATLDPDDWAYDGYYENSLDNDVFNKAKGFNYHQGPEWTWVLGAFLRAKFHFTADKDKEIIIQRIYNILSTHYDILCESNWKGLPELTNKNGSNCMDSCPTQAWSMACLMEVLYDIEQFYAD